MASKVDDKASLGRTPVFGNSTLSYGDLGYQNPARTVYAVGKKIKIPNSCCGLEFSSTKNREELIIFLLDRILEFPQKTLHVENRHPNVRKKICDWLRFSGLKLSVLIITVKLTEWRSQVVRGKTD